MNAIQIVSWLIATFNMSVAVVIVFAIARSFARVLQGSLEVARLEVANGILNGLFFFTAATVLKTIHAATWDDIGKLFAILSLRTALKFVVRREREILTRGSTK